MSMVALVGSRMQVKEVLNIQVRPTQDLPGPIALNQSQSQKHYFPVMMFRKGLDMCKVSHDFNVFQKYV